MDLHRSVREVEWVPLAKLLLDPDNPRLTSIDAGRSQFELLAALYSEMSVDELALSIAENGYFVEEPLLVIPASDQKGKFVVVEGNRRLAAVLLLTNDGFRRRLNASDLPEISSSAKAALEQLPVLKYQDKKSLWQFLGFRHINGVKAWDSFSKAAYVTEIHEKYRVPLDEIAQKIGDRHATVARLFRGYIVLRQAERQGFSKDDRVRNRFYFSHLYTALEYPEFQGHLSLDERSFSRSNPVPVARKKELQEFMEWLYGSKSRGVEPVVKSQNPDLNFLRQVVGSGPALAALRNGASLRTAFDVSIGDRRRFEDSVYGAEESLKQALGVAHKGYNRKNREIVRAIESVEELASLLAEQTNRKRSSNA